MAEVFQRFPKSTGTGGNTTVVRDSNGEIFGVWDAASIVAGTDLDTMLTQGMYAQFTLANATTALHYPQNNQPGILEVVQYENASGRIQRYTCRDNGTIWSRYYSGSAWTSWIQAGAPTAPEFLAGMVQLWGGTGAPAGWLVCDGAAISRTTYAALFAAIGTLYGVGDGSTTFNLPDTISRFVEGSTVPGDSGGNGTHTHSLNSAVADLRVSGTGTTIYAQDRPAPASRTLGRSFIAGGAMADASFASSAGLALSGSTDVQSSLPPYVDLVYIIKT